MPGLPVATGGGPAWPDTGSPRCGPLSWVGRPTQTGPALSRGRAAPHVTSCSSALPSAPRVSPGLRKRRFRSLPARILGSDALPALTWQNLPPCSHVLFPSLSLGSSRRLLCWFLFCWRAWYPVLGWGQDPVAGFAWDSRVRWDPSPFTYWPCDSGILCNLTGLGFPIWVMGTIEYTSTEGRITAC